MPKGIILLFALLILQSSCSQNPKSKSESAYEESESSNPPPDSSLHYIPKPIGWTNDFSRLFTENEINILDSIISNYEEKTTNEIAIVTVKSRMLGNMNFEAYSTLMINTWGIGKKDKNNGILIAIFPHLRSLRVENGIGIESILSDGETKKIIESTFIPLFKEGKFFEGTLSGLKAIMAALERNARNEKIILPDVNFNK